MQQELPITINADGKFSTALTPLLNKLQMWINFQALKANWFSNEDCILSFHFTLVKSLHDKAQEIQTEKWTLDNGFAYRYQQDTLKTVAYIEVQDLKNANLDIEKGIKMRMTNAANLIALQHGLTALSL